MSFDADISASPFPERMRIFFNGLHVRNMIHSVAKNLQRYYSLNLSMEKDKCQASGTLEKKFL